MSRLPDLPPSDLEGEQKSFYQFTSQTIDGMFGDKFTAKKDDGTLVGPFGLFLYTPAVGRSYLELAENLGKLPGLPAKAREIAILVTGAYYKSAYELYAHERVALSVGISQEVVDRVKKGEKPTGLDQDASVAYDVTKALLGKPGDLDEELYAKSISVLGQGGTIALVHYVGCYAYTSVLLNAFAVKAPQDE